MALSQTLQQKLQQRLSPQQIQLMKLLQIPTANLEERIKEELEENPALEVSEEGSGEEFEERGEEFDSAEEEYGRDRLVEAVRQSRQLSAREIIDRLHRDVIDWTEGRGAHDDVTFFIIKAL